jgi:hypothetical protein
MNLSYLPQVKNKDCQVESLYTQLYEEEDSVKLHSRNLNTIDFVNSGEIITSDKIMDALSGDSSFLYYKRDFLYKAGIWRNEKIPALYKNPKSFRGKTIVLGHSDKSIRVRDSWVLTQMGAKNVIGFNHIPNSKISAGIPLGITNNCDDSERHRIMGNESHFLIAGESSEFSDRFTNSIYLNMTISNNSPERSKLYLALNDQKNVTIQTPLLSDQGRIAYLKSLRHHNLVPCPVGNGIDTHRIWETLYMGGTPVIKKNRVLESLLAGLPVIILDAWDNLRNFELMEHKWTAIQQTKWDMTALNLTFQLGRLNQL